MSDQRTREQLEAAVEQPAAGENAASEAEPAPDHEEALRRLGEMQQQMPALLDKLLGCDAHSRDKRPAAPRLAGVYLFTEKGVVPLGRPDPKLQPSLQ